MNYYNRRREQWEHEEKLERERQEFEQDLEDERQQFNKKMEQERQAHADELLKEQERLRKLAEREALSVCLAADGEKLLGTYDGELSNGIASGEGKFFFDNGDCYIGRFLGGKFHGQGKMIRRDGEVRYEGEWEVGYFHGTGTYYYSGYDVKKRKSYQGSFFRGLRQGKGVLLWSDGTRYEGDFAQNEMNGHGVMVWPCGDRYEGQFALGARDGKGKYTSCDGYCYEGYWKAGNRHGEGTLTYPDGSSTTGEWSEDKPYGGLFRTSENKQIEYEGEFANGVREGFGVLYHKSGNKIYEGYWKDNQYSGEGILHHYVDDKLCYTAEGIFKMGKLHKGQYQDEKYIAKGDFDKNGLFYSGELYKNDVLFLNGNIDTGNYDLYFNKEVFHVKPIFGLITDIGTNDKGSAYILVDINSFEHDHGGNNFDTILIRQCEIVKKYVTDGRSNEWLYATDGSGYLQLLTKKGEGELHFTSNEPSVLMQNYGVPLRDNIHFVLTGRFKNGQPTGECVLKDDPKKPTFSETVKYVRGKRNGKFEWNFENGCQRTVTGSYHKGVMSPIGCIEYHDSWEKPQKKYEGEINHQGLPDGLGTLTTKTHEGWDNFSTKTIYGIWENGECIKELSPLVYLFYKIKKIIKK